MIKAPSFITFESIPRLTQLNQKDQVLCFCFTLNNFELSSRGISSTSKECVKRRRQHRSLPSLPLSATRSRRSWRGASKNPPPAAQSITHCINHFMACTHSLTPPPPLPPRKAGRSIHNAIKVLKRANFPHLSSYFTTLQCSRVQLHKYFGEGIKFILSAKSDKYRLFRKEYFKCPGRRS